MTFEEFAALIPAIQKAKLGGMEAQFRLAPAYREKYDLDFIKSKNPLLAAVLLLIFPDKDLNMRFLLIKRPDYAGHHANQISFTGGKKSEKDFDLLETAIRETEEEVGIKIYQNQILKTLTEVYIPPSNFLVQPYMAWIPSTPAFYPNYEVEKLMTPLLHNFLNVKNIQTKDVIGSHGKSWKSPGFILEDEFVWGATAMIISEIIDLFGKVYK